MAEAEEKYTDPELRERLKEEIKAGDKGAAAGQWSARKSQLLVQAYERHGGGYRGPQREEQQHLERWTEENWQTKDGSAQARHDDGTSRYLPEKAWDELSEEEKEATERKKKQGSREGHQHVGNTAAAKKARAGAGRLPIDGYDDLTAKEVVSRVRDLGPDALAAVREHEESHAARKTVLEALDRAERAS